MDCNSLVICCLMNCPKTVNLNNIIRLRLIPWKYFSTKRRKHLVSISDYQKLIRSTIQLANRVQNIIQVIWIKWKIVKCLLHLKKRALTNKSNCLSLKKNNIILFHLFYRTKERVYSKEVNCKDAYNFICVLPDAAHATHCKAECKYESSCSSVTEVDTCKYSNSHLNLYVDFQTCRTFAFPLVTKSGVETK